MHRFISILVICLFACTACTHTSQPPTRPTSFTTQPTLKPIDLHYSIYLARFDQRITVSPDGLLRSVQTENKSYGGNDIDPKLQRIEIREGKLTLQQMTDLSRLFANWGSLSSTASGNLADGPDISIRYGDKTISGGTELPRQVMNIQVKLTELARSMPLVDH